MSANNGIELGIGSSRQLNLRNRTITINSRVVKKPRINKIFVTQKYETYLTQSINLSSLKSLPLACKSLNSVASCKGMEEMLDYEHENESFLNHNEREDKTLEILSNKEILSSWNGSTINNSYDGSAASEVLSVLSYRSFKPNRTINSLTKDQDNGYYRYTPQSFRSQFIDSSSSSGSTSSSRSCSSPDREAKEELEDKSELDYDMTNEEEDYLLQSSEEENNDKFSSSSVKYDHNVNINSLSQKKVVMSGKNIIIRAINEESNKGYRKWDIRYHPYEDLRVFLNDLGYIPPPPPLFKDNNLTLLRKSSVSSDTSDDNGHKSVTSVKVTIDQNLERTCKPFKKTFNSNDSAFKLPLPPVKRPPTRPGKSNSSISSANSSLNDNFNNVRENKFNLEATREKRIKDDDELSIYAPTLAASEQLDQELNDDSKSFTSISEQDESLNNRNFVEKWISTQIEIPNNLTHSNIKNPITTLISNFESEKDTSKGTGIRICFKDIPQFFAGLCFHYYFNENCYLPRCKIPHTINNHTYFKKCKDLSIPELKHVYNYSMRFHTLFKEIYPVYLKGFSYHKMQTELIESIQIFFDLKNILDLSVAISKVINELQEMGHSFLDAIELISFNYGLLKYPELADILLDIITQQPKVSENWDEIKRICRAKKYIPPKYLERILSNVLVTNDLNSDLAKDIYNVIVKNNMTDLSEVSPVLLSPLKTLCKFGLNTKNQTIPVEQRNEKSSSSQSIIMESIYSGRSSSASNQSLSEVENWNNHENSSEAPSTHFYTTACHSISNDVHFPPLIKTVTPNPTDIQISSTNKSFTPIPDIQFSLPSTSKDNQFFAGANSITQTPRDIQNSTTFRTVTQSSRGVHISSHFENKTTTNRPTINLTPEIPIFGKFKYSNDFNFKQLHNLLFSSQDMVIINESDIIKLKDIIIFGNGCEFLRILQNYKSESTIENFITTTLVHLKNSGKPYQALMGLVDNIESIDPTFVHDPFLKGVFEVIVFNLLFIMERSCQFIEASKLLEKFCDWDSLISSKLLQIFTNKQLTPMGRFLYLARFFTEAKKFYIVYEILQSPDLHLLENSSQWPLPYCKEDIRRRSVILTKFFKEAYLHNVEVVCDMYKNILQFGDIWEFNASQYFNVMFEYMINRKKISMLKHFYSDIHIFYKKMTKNVFRAFIIILEPQLSVENKINLYDLAVEKGLYTKYTGTETNLALRTNMPDEELRFVLTYFLYKRSQITIFRSNNFRIELKLQDRNESIPNSIFLLQNSYRSIMEVNKSVRNILKKFFKIETKDFNSNITYIDV